MPHGAQQSLDLGVCVYNKLVLMHSLISDTGRGGYGEVATSFLLGWGPIAN